MHYFSYGSNMSIKRLLERVPSARKVSIGILEGHELKFHKISNIDGSAKCDAKHTGNPVHLVYGVVFRISPEDKSKLDSKEGLGFGYDQKDVLIKLNDGSVIEAYTYYATKIDSTLMPLDWYKEHVIRGAKENDLPDEYIRVIEEIESVDDADIERRNRELSIYRK